MQPPLLCLIYPSGATLPTHTKGLISLYFCCRQSQ
jgi:hypothetical protein